MSVVIVGGNECMTRQYIDICNEYKCSAKVFCKMRDGLKNKVGSPDLLVLFTNTTSHKMVKCALSEIKGTGAMVARSHSSSASALRNILTQHSCKE
ncbi:MAG: DUF2325 domain-containing protein [Oscillospiraceae bacterium]|nr:DUF2325 domain-containing protein [Oscillospiraceae bacterium]